MGRKGFIETPEAGPDRTVAMENGEYGELRTARKALPGANVTREKTKSR